MRYGEKNSEISVWTAILRDASGRQLYRLGLPNIEVKQGFFEFLWPYYSNMRTNDVRVFVFDFFDEMEEGRVEAVRKRLEAMFAGIGYEKN